MNDARRVGPAAARMASSVVALLALVLASACTTTSARERPDALHEPDAGGVLTVDAERYHIAGRLPWREVTHPKGYLGPAAMEAPDPEDADDLEPMEYDVRLPSAGRYFVWLRGNPPTIGRDSVHVGLNGVWEDRIPMELASIDTWSWTDTTVHDERGVLEVPSAGSHTLTVWARDEEVLLDRIVLAPDPSYVPPLEQGELLWTADHEGGDLSEWTGSRDGLTCGGEFNNDGGAAHITRDVVRSGEHAVELRISNVEGDQGTRLFRGRCESLRHDGLYYSAWLYFPEPYATVDEWWNVWQWKSQGPDDVDSEVQWVLDVRGDGEAMYFRMRDKLDEDTTWYDQEDPRPIPIGRWFHVEAFYRSAENETGRVVVWQDGVEIFRFHDVRTVKRGGDTRWSVNNYTSGIRPDPALLYVDDAAISKRRLGPELAADHGENR